jgi:hypothetical protein
VGILDPTPPPYDALEWRRLPFRERARMVCEAWALQGYGSPIGVYLAYALKVGLYIGGWLFFCSLSPTLGGPTSVSSFWLSPLAFQKAIVFSLLFEVLGLGCGSGPLTGRYFPPVGGFLHFLRPGTIKLSLAPSLPLIGGTRRTWFDVLLYAGLCAASVRALCVSTPSFTHFAPIVVLLAVLAFCDKTVFLAARGEHYGLTILCFAWTDHWIACAMAVQLALWFWAGVSKLNHHFPAVVCVMTSNHPFARFAWLRKLMYRSFPSDLRPSSVAVWTAHLGTLVEMAVPIAFLLTPLGREPIVAIVMMLALHGYITSNVPMGVPIEWNVMVVYGGFALFYAHPDISLSTIPLPVDLVLVVALVVVPLVGAIWPGRVSFLVAMRYYSGNWPFSVWLFRGKAHEKLDRLVKSSAWVYDQLGRFYDEKTAVGLVGKVVGFRLMHLHGRALPLLVPKAVVRLEDYEWVDGEIVAGLALGWNFGDGHLHDERLVSAIQAVCDFEEGELRAIICESQPLFGRSLVYRIVDAKTGLVEAGELSVDELRSRQPWEATIPLGSPRA